MVLDRGLNEFMVCGSLIAFGNIKENVCFAYDALCPSQQFFSHVRTISCLPGLNLY